jgi:dTDP-4-amino-4,6-dideoxy-D-galactose acyltransferase
MNIVNEAGGPCEFLSWDSEFFGKRIARVLGENLTASEADRVVAWGKEHALDCIYFLSNLAPEGMLAAQERGFHAVDIRVQLETLLGSAAEHGAADARVRPSSPEDLADLREIAGRSHTDSRFYQDGGFSRGKCDELYRVWIENSCRGSADRVFVAEDQGRPVGYVTCEVAGERGKIGLIAVAPSAQGKGLGSALVGTALSWMRNRGLRAASVVTQGRNFRAQRLYQSHGFVTESMYLWFHLWLPLRTQ